MARPQARKPGGWPRLLLWATIAVAALVVAAPAQGARFAYVTSVGPEGAGPGTISQYQTGAGGLLAPLSPPTLTTGEFPASLAVSPDGRSVYVPASHNVYQYDLGADGTLSPKSPAAVGAGSVPYHVAVSANGRNMYVVNAGSGDISQYNVGPGGRLSPKSPARVATAFEPLGLAVSPDSKSVYVTNSPPEHPTGPPHVTQYDVKAGGRLSPKNPATVATGRGPRDVAVSPDGKSAYVITHEYPDFSVYQYDIGAGGRLAPKSPAKVAADSFPWAMAVSPDGKSVYVTSDDPGNDISQYTIGPGGRLARKSPATVPAGRSPSGIAVSPDSRSVYVDIAGDNDVAQYNVGAGGRLHPKSPATVPTAAGPYGVALTPRTPGWEGWVRNPASGCMARVQVPYLDGNRQVTAYTEVSCPRPTKLTIRSRLRSDYPSTDATVAQQGCLTGCVVEEPQGHRFFRLTCPKSASRQDHQPYYSDILIYPGANSGAATRERSRDKFLSPFCAH